MRFADSQLEGYVYGETRPPYHPDRRESRPASRGFLRWAACYEPFALGWVSRGVRKAVSGRGDSWKPMGYALAAPRVQTDTSQRPEAVTGCSESQTDDPRDICA
jgi:hypothetical protein